MFVENEKSMRALQDALGDHPFETRWILLTGSSKATIPSMDDPRLKADASDDRAARNLRTDVQSEYTDADYAILYLTSGATGEPKMGLVTHSALVANVDMGPPRCRSTRTTAPSASCLPRTSRSASSSNCFPSAWACPSGSPKVSPRCRPSCDPSARPSSWRRRVSGSASTATI